MPKTLLVDTNRAAVPLYHSLIKKGHEVWVVGKNPEETLAKMAENYCQLDYSDTHALSEFIDKNEFDFIVPGCTDLSYEMCATVGNGKFLGIDTLDTTNKINSKDEFKKLVGELSIPAPRLISQEEAINHSSVIVKPVDSYSGQGIQVLFRPDEQRLNAAINSARAYSKSKSVLIEEYITGQLYSYSCFLQAGSIVAGFIVQEDGSANPFTVDTSQVTDDLSESLKLSLESDIQKIAGELGLSEGLVHLQFLSDGSDYWVIEMTRRCPGDIYALLIEYATGYEYSDSYVAPFIGEKIAPAPRPLVKKNIIRHTVTSAKGQTFWGLQLKRPVKIILFVPLVTSGKVAKPDSCLRLGVIFIEASSVEEQARLYKELISKSLYQLGFPGESDE